MIYIPIGVQCNSASFLRKNNLRNIALPFDWCFSTPKNVYEILDRMINTNITIEELVKEHFFNCDKKSNNNRIPEHYFDDDEGFALYNSKYGFIFPHDKYDTETIDKFIRRFKRLYEILNLCTVEMPDCVKTNDICFLYTSQSSLENGNVTMNGNTLPQDVYYYLNKIYHLVNNTRGENKCKMIVFDAILNENVGILDKDIVLYKLEKCDKWREMIPQMNEFLDDFQKV